MWPAGADVTLGVLEVPRMEATGFGVMHVDEHDTIQSFVEKPADPPAVPGHPDLALASMGIYVFDTHYLVELLKADAADPHSEHDFGKDLVPYVVKHGKAVAHRFSASCVRAALEAEAYWRDVGTIDAYWESNIDLTAVTPALDLYDTDWPIWTYAELTATGQVRARRAGPPRQRRGLPGVGRLHRLGHRAAPLAAVHRGAHAFLRPHRRGGDPAACRHRPPRAAEAAWSLTEGCTSRPAWWSARTPNSTPGASDAPNAASA
jgi:hypothetical protein